MEDKEQIFALIAAAQENQQVINGLLRQLEARTEALKNTEQTLIQAVSAAAGEALAQATANERKILEEAVLHAKMTFQALRPASWFDYFYGAMIGAIIGALVMAGLFYWLIKSDGIGQKPISLDANALGRYIVEHTHQRKK
jgi:hypothetical protein